MEANLVPEIRSSKIEIQSWTCEDSPKAYGLESDIRSLEALFRQRENENQFKAIGIAGLLGVGKTALCQQLLSRSEYKSHFLPMIWVCMSREPTEEEGNETKIKKFREDENQRKLTVLKRMLSNLGVDDEDSQITASIPQDNVQDKLKAMLYVLHLQLKGKRYMVVLDDAREINEWYNDLGCSWSIGGKEQWGHRLAHGLPKGSGGTVIVTSRIEEVAKMMVREERNIHRLLPHSDPESFWLIFTDSCKKTRCESENNEAKENEKKFDNADQEKNATYKAETYKEMWWPSVNCKVDGFEERIQGADFEGNRTNRQQI